MNARERHLEWLGAAREELRGLTRGTPHRRDLLRHIRRLERELKAYDMLKPTTCSPGKIKWVNNGGMIRAIL